MLEIHHGNTPPSLAFINPYVMLTVIDAADFAGVTRLRIALAMQRGELAFAEIDGRRVTCAAWIADWRRAQ